jgi:hypothetical protein
MSAVERADAAREPLAEPPEGGERALQSWER